MSYFNLSYKGPFVCSTLCKCTRDTQYCDCCRPTRNLLVSKGSYCVESSRLKICRCMQSLSEVRMRDIFRFERPTKTLPKSMIHVRGAKVSPCVVPRPRWGDEGGQCRVDGALRAVLRVSRVLGAAPVKLGGLKDQGLMQYHAAASLYSCLLVCVLVAMTIIVLVLDIRVGPERSVRSTDQMKCLVWILDVALVSAMLVSSVYTGPERVRQLITVLNELEKIDTELKNKRKSVSDRKLMRLTIITLLLSLPLYALDILKFVWETFQENREWILACCYVSFYMMYLLRTLITAQFILTAFAVNFTLRAVNDELQSKLSDDNRCSSYISIRRLARYHGTLCDLIVALSRSYSTILITLVVGFLLYLVIAPYYLLGIIFESSHAKPMFTLLQSLWCMYHLLFMIAVIEPCHMTTDEITRTKELLSQLMRRVSCLSEPPHEQISLFMSQLSLSAVHYSPYGFCVLHRPLIATIIGGVTTYLVIIIQFQGKIIPK